MLGCGGGSIYNVVLGKYSELNALYLSCRLVELGKFKAYEKTSQKIVQFVRLCDDC